MTDSPERTAPAIVGVDIGGTFTDFVVVTRGEVRIHKVPSTPADPSVGFLRGLDDLGLDRIARYVHGSTVATNALLERKGARAALLTTQGFRDLLELGRQTRNELYALTPTKPMPLIPRARCFEVPERVEKGGNVLTPLDEAAVRDVLDRLHAAGVESLAVVFLFSYVRPEHERRVGELARERGFAVSLSSEIYPEYREYERASTTAANAYVAPLMDRYLGRLESRLAERNTGSHVGGASEGPVRLQIMQSNGGLISAAVARREAVRTVLSGPAGGVVGAWRIGRRAGFHRLLTFDMGGTSTDVAVVLGAPASSTEGSIAGLPVRTPMLDIHTVGAGGGSLARVDSGGGLRVGPESAGADPGPASYGRGTLPTVTDANLVLGRLQPERFLGGRMALYPARAREALSPLARQLGLSLERAAAGVVQVANAQMARALRFVSVERGHDPRELSLVAFGGSGPLHACELAAELGVRMVLVPRFPGTLSALGMLLSDVRKEYSRTVMLPGGGRELPGLEAVFLGLESAASADLLSEGVPANDIFLERLLDVRYQGQSYELTVAAPRLDATAIEEAFHAAYEQRFGYGRAGVPWEVVNVRLRAAGVTPGPELPYREAVAGAHAQPVATSRAWVDDRWRECPVYDRERMAPGERIAGPATLVQEDATTWLPAGWSGVVDGWYNVVVTGDV